MGSGGWAGLEQGDAGGAPRGAHSAHIAVYTVIHNHCHSDICVAQIAVYCDAVYTVRLTVCVVWGGQVSNKEMQEAHREESAERKDDAALGF